MRIIGFGDSWTAGHGVETNSIYKENPTPPLFIEKLREQNSWPRWVSEKYNIPYVNCGVCGFGNEYILQTVKDCVNKKFINKNDKIIIVFTHPRRYEKYNKYSSQELFQEFENILNGYEHYYFNGFYPLFNHDTNIKNLPDYYINPNQTLSYILQLEEIENNKSVWEYDSKSVWNDEKNYFEGDYHPNLNGYKIISEHIYREIESIK